MTDLQIVEEKKTVAVAEDYKAIATEWLTATGNLQKFSENEKKQFIDICCAYGLNPIKKEVYGIKYGDKFNLIVGYESYIKRAEASGRLSGWHVDYISSEEKAVITIYRKDWQYPFVHEVYLSEYKESKGLWPSKPITMLKKVAIAQGFRMCFTEVLGGIPYTAEELPEEMTKTVSANTDTASNNSSVETSKKSTPKIKPLYTKEQAEEIGKIVNSVYENNAPIFTEEEKSSYREMLKNGLYEDARKSALDLFNERFGNAKKMADGISAAFGE